MLGTILICFLLVALLATFPFGASYNAGWGYGPSGGVGLLLIVLIVLLATGEM